jgi:hypothetical protein
MIPKSVQRLSEKIMRKHMSWTVMTLEDKVITL